MTLIPGIEPYAIAVKRIQRKAQAFGTSALEIMLIITFLILLMLLTYFSSSTHAGNRTGAVARLRTENKALDAIVEDSMEALGPADSPAAERPNRLPERIAHLTRQLETALAEKRASAETVKELQTRNEELAEQLRESDRGDDTGEHDWPPIIRLDEADGYSFRTNSSEISPSFAGLLRQTVVPRILEISAQFDADTIEIVGHTDERPIAGASTLDENLLPFLHGNPDVPLAAADNAGLGFARAAAVVRVLSESRGLADHYLTPLSGAQVLMRDGAIADGAQSGDRPRRRRIEIRMRRSDVVAPWRRASR